MKWCPNCRFWRTTTEYEHKNGDIYQKETVCDKCNCTLSIRTYTKVVDKDLLLEKIDACLARIKQEMSK